MSNHVDSSQTADAKPRMSVKNVGYMAAMGAMSSGLTAVDFLTNNVIPITLRHFTDSRLLISIIIDLNRLFGFVVQPYVAWKSDGTVTRFGRRRPFLLIGIPATLVSVMALAYMPVYFDSWTVRNTLSVTPSLFNFAAMREILSAMPYAVWYSLATIVILFMVNVSLQAFLDVNWGVEALLYADTFPKALLGRAYSVRQTVMQCATLLLLLYSLPLHDINEVYPYFGSGIMLMAAFLVVLLVLRERPVPKIAERKEFRVLADLRLLITNKTYLKVALVAVMQLVFAAIFTLFLSLFAKETLGLTMKEFSREVLFLGFAVGVGTALIGGQLVDKIGAKYIAAIGFVACMASALLMVWFVHDKHDLKIVNAVSLAGQALCGVAAFPLIFLHAPEDQRGKVFGIAQFMRAFSAFAITPLAGHLADKYKSYRPVYVIAIVLALIGLAAALSVPKHPAHEKD